MKTLTAMAFLVAMMVTASANANMGLKQEGMQNYYYYFGAPCPVVAVVNPCVTEPPCPVVMADPCEPCKPVCSVVCCQEVRGIFG